jgi:hypothetical protein
MARFEMFDDAALINSLDEVWRSPRQIRIRLGTRGIRLGTRDLNYTRVALALDRLADMDQIERRTQKIDVPKRAGGNLSIKHYRRRPLPAGN